MRHVRRPADRWSGLSGGRRHLGWVAAGAAALVVCGCGSSTGGQAAPSTPATSTTPTTATVPTTVAPTTVATTTTLPPPDPQSTPDLASGAFIRAWEQRDRAAAAKVATPAAVASLFATAYAGETLNDRGCGSPGPNPVVCSWGPYGGASPADPEFDVTVTPAGADWYVSDVTSLS